MLTIENIKSELLNSWWGGWKITDVLDEVYKTDDKLYITGPKHYSIRFVYYRADGMGLGPHGSHSGTLLLGREEDDYFKRGRYRFELWLNGKLFLTDGLNSNALRDKNSFIESVVSALDYQLHNSC